MNKKAVVLVSGGLDSAVTLYQAIDDLGKDAKIYALTFDYGQRHAVEIKAAQKVVDSVNDNIIKHLTVRIDTSLFATASALTDRRKKVSKKPLDPVSEKIPTTYVPARNFIFLSYAAAWAQAVDADTVWIGAHANDAGGYPDCRQAFFYRFEGAMLVGLPMPRYIRMPLIDLEKYEIVDWGFRLGVPFELTHSCYDPVEGESCGECGSCQLRLAAFAKIEKKDPLPYRRNG